MTISSIFLIAQIAQIVFRQEDRSSQDQQQIRMIESSQIAAVISLAPFCFCIVSIILHYAYHRPFLIDVD
jgi:L-asparagine transporter-like permease